MKNKSEYRINEININNQGLKMWICNYKNAQDIDVEFEDGYISKNRRYQHFQNGTIKNPYYPEVFGIGYIGEEEKNNVKKTKEYYIWHGMIERCYSGNYSTYENCHVCEEWHNFQNFLKWFKENYYEIDGERVDLDKDILFKGNKVYSPNTCIFVPHSINSLFTKSNSARGKYLIGVYYNKQKKKFVAQCKINNNNKNNNKKERKYLGSFDTEIEAFNAYKKFKEDYIKQVANKYKDKIPKKLYDAMYNWKVEVND